MTTHFLTWLLVVPAVSALVVLLLPRGWDTVIKRFSIELLRTQILKQAGLQ